MEIKYKCTPIKEEETKYEVIFTYAVWSDCDQCYGEDRHRVTCSTREGAEKVIAEDWYAHKHLAGRIFRRTSVIVRKVEYTTIARF